MKRIFTLLLVAVMLVSTLAVTAGAKGKLIYSDNFDDGFKPKNWITDRDSCHFEWVKKDGAITGYSDSVVLQSNYGIKNNKWWEQGYMSIDFCVNDYDDVDGERESHGVSLWYRDRMEEKDDYGAVYMFDVEFETGNAELTKSHSWTYYVNGVATPAETNVVIATGNIYDDEFTAVEFGEFYELGWRITSGKIECYFDQKLIISAEADPTEPVLGSYTQNTVDTSVGSQKGAFLFWNHGNWITLDNFEVWSADYDFVASTPGDANCDGVFDIADVTTLLQSIAGWELETYDSSAADVIGDDGNADMNDVIYMLQTIAGWEGCVIG